jgi:hypothetical protein
VHYTLLQGPNQNLFSCFGSGRAVRDIEDGASEMPRVPSRTDRVWAGGLDAHIDRNAHAGVLAVLERAKHQVHTGYDTETAEPAAPGTSYGLRSGSQRHMVPNRNAKNPERTEWRVKSK